MSDRSYWAAKLYDEAELAGVPLKPYMCMEECLCLILRWIRHHDLKHEAELDNLREAQERG